MNSESFLSFIFCVISTGFGLCSGIHWSTECSKVCVCLSSTDHLTGVVMKIVDCSGGRVQDETRLSLPSGIDILNLSGNKISMSTVRNLLTSLHGLRNLNLSRNDIWKVREMRELQVHLEELDISINSVSGIPGNWILYPDKLKLLNMSRNKIEFIHTTAFDKMTQLKYLDLSHNKIWQLHKKWFHDLIGLQRLDLSHNMISSLAAKLFQHLTSLINLDLSKNRINNIDLGAFHGLSSLKYLYLNGNQIKDSFSDKMNNGYKVSILDLSDNSFSRLETNAFNNLPVEHLVLNSQKYLTYVNRGVFVNMPNLVSLEMSGNTLLEYIDRQAFHNVPMLRVVSLTDNKLSAIFNQTISTLASLQELSIKGNPMICDCNVHWLLTDHRDGLQIVDLNDTVCHGPPTLTGRVLSQSLRWYIPSMCRPEILPHFPPNSSRLFGQSLHMECYAVGNPPPDIYWLFSKKPSTKFCSSNRTESLHPFRSGRTLSLNQLTFHNTGLYECIAQNSQGRTGKCFHITVEGNKGDIVVLGATDKSILFTWNGTNPKIEYKLLYRVKTNSSRLEYSVINITPGMKKYSLINLNSSTSFEICIALSTDQLFVDRKCQTVSTLQRQSHHDGIYSARSLFIGLCVGGGAVVMVCLSIIWIAIKKYNKSQSISRYMLPQSTSRQRIVSSTDGRSSVATPTTYENKMLELSDEECFIEESEASFPPVIT